MNLKNNKVDLTLFEDISVLYDYPKEDLLPVISSLIKKFSSFDNALYYQAIDKLNAFFDYCSSNVVTKLEEDYVSAFDMNTKYILYVGHLIYGENYERSDYIAKLNDMYKRNHFTIEGQELPDHLIVFLRFFSNEHVNSKDKKFLLDDLKEAFINESDIRKQKEETFVLQIEQNNKYPILHYLIEDLIKIFETWEIA